MRKRVKDRFIDMNLARKTRTSDIEEDGGVQND